MKKLCLIALLVRLCLSPEHVLAGDFNPFKGYPADPIFRSATITSALQLISPAADDTWNGPTLAGVAGEALSQWDIVYAKNAAGALKYYKYDANGADKAYYPRGIAVTSAAGDASAFTVGIGVGLARNDGWGHTNNQDEGKTVYADDGTAGGITFTAPSDAGDKVCVVGFVLEQNVVQIILSGVCGEI